MNLTILGLLLLFTSATSCRADDLTGGYAMSWPGSISYLRLVQRGQNVTGYMQSVTIDPSGGGKTQTMKTNVAGSVSGRIIQLQIGGDTTDGTWGSGGVMLDTPANGYVARMHFRRTSVEAWNRTVAAFVAGQARETQLRRLQADYDQQKAQYLAAKDNVPLARRQLAEALADQERGQQALKDAQAEYNKAKAAFDTALADLRAKVVAGREIVVQGRHDAANKDMDAVAKDGDAANAAQAAANTAQSAANAAQTQVNNAEARLSAVRDNQISGLPAADRAVAEARARLSHDMSVMVTAAALAGDDAKKHRALMPPKPMGRKNR